MNREAKLLMVLTAMMAATLITSNIAATKIWDFGGAPVDGGLIVFPISYITSDLLMEFYGRKTANFVAVVAMVMNLVAMLLLVAVVHLPAYSGFDDSAFAAVLGFSVRISIASLTSFLLSSFTNNYVFAKIREQTSSYVMRALTSSLVGRIVDIAVFEVIGFLGVLSFSEFLMQAAGAYIEGELIELLVLGLVGEKLVWRIQWWLDGDPEKKSVF